jgi:hypothetical protein
MPQQRTKPDQHQTCRNNQRNRINNRHAAITNRHAAVSREFGIAVCGTVSGSIVVYSLFNGTKVNVIHLGGFRPVKVFGDDSLRIHRRIRIDEHDRETVNRIFVHNVNGRLIRAIEIGSSVKVCRDLSKQMPRAANFHVYKVA